MRETGRDKVQCEQNRSDPGDRAVSDTGDKGADEGSGEEGGKGVETADQGVFGCGCAGEGVVRDVVTLEDAIAVEVSLRTRNGTTNEKRKEE